MCYLEVCHVISKCGFSSSHSVISTLIPLWAEDILCMIYILLNILRCVLWLRMWVSWWMFHVSLGRMCILLFLDWVFYKHQLNQVGWLCYSGKLYPYWYSPCLIYQLLKWKSPAITVDSFISSCRPVSFATHILMLFLGTHTLKTIRSSRTIGSLIGVSLYPWYIFFVLMPVLPEINVAIPTFSDEC